MDTTPESRIQEFSKELGYISSPAIRSFVAAVLKEVPEYFFHIPASSTGKYHPAYALGEGGLVRHVHAAIGIARDLFEMSPEEFSTPDRDCIIAALILHDCMKNGDGSDPHTVTNHPSLMADKVVQFSLADHPDWQLRSEDVYIISTLIETHMGRWVEDPKTKMVVLSKPKTAMQKWVHLCDYLASRKHLEYKFDV
jgi:23S rRNA maturation-related 3'-5' exoribonuclease YhaM